MKKRTKSLSILSCYTEDILDDKNTPNSYDDNFTDNDKATKVMCDMEVKKSFLTEIEKKYNGLDRQDGNYIQIYTKLDK